MICPDITTFFRAFLRKPGRIGAVTPSSSRLVSTVVDWFDWPSIRSAVEFGPGTGAFTKAIVPKLHDDATFFAIERDPVLCKRVREHCPSVKVYKNCIENVGRLCEKQNVEQLDAVVSGVPWAAFDDEQQQTCLDAMLNVLRPGGQFAAFAHWEGMLKPAAHRFRKRLEEKFTTVETSPTVWRNLPPAFVYRCVR